MEDRNRRDSLRAASSLARAPRPLAATARPARVALVTADLESRLVAVDLRSGHVRRYVATHSYPRSVEAVGAAAVVAHSEIGVVTLVHAPSLTVAQVLHDFGEPRYTAGHPNGRHAYVTDAERGEVVALDVRRGEVRGRLHVGPLARHVTIDPRGQRLWVALGPKAREIAIVNVADRARPRLA